MTTLTGFVLAASIIGNLAFGFKSLSQVIKCIKQRSVYGISKVMLLLDFVGNIGCGYSIYMTTGFTLWPQFINYFCATLFLIILFVLLFALRKKKEILYDADELLLERQTNNTYQQKAETFDRLCRMNTMFAKAAMELILSDAKIQASESNSKFTIVDGRLHPIQDDHHIQHNVD